MPEGCGHGTIGFCTRCQEDQTLRTARGWQERAERAEKNWKICRRWAIAGGAPVEKLGDDPDVPFGVAPSVVPSLTEFIREALNALEDNDNHAATVILRNALGVKETPNG